MKSKTKLAIVAAFNLAMAGPALAATLTNPVIPLHRTLKSSTTTPTTGTHTLQHAALPQLKVVQRPDITSHGGPRIGGKYVPWGGSVNIGRHNAKRIQNGRCVFDVVYPISNDGKVATGPVFVNRLRDGSTVTALNSSMHLNAGVKKQINTEQSLLPGKHVMGLSLDDSNAVKESRENNNVFRFIVKVDNSCSINSLHPIKPKLKSKVLPNTDMKIGVKLNPQPEPPSAKSHQ